MRPVVNTFSPNYRNGSRTVESNMELPPRVAAVLSGSWPRPARAVLGPGTGGGGSGSGGTGPGPGGSGPGGPGGLGTGGVGPGTGGSGAGGSGGGPGIGGIGSGSGLGGLGTGGIGPGSGGLGAGGGPGSGSGTGGTGCCTAITYFVAGSSGSCSSAGDAMMRRPPWPRAAPRSGVPPGASPDTSSSVGPTRRLPRMCGSVGPPARSGRRCARRRSLGSRPHGSAPSGTPVREPRAVR